MLFSAFAFNGFTADEAPVYELKGYTIAESTLSIYPAGSSFFEGANGGTTSTIFRMIEYTAGHKYDAHDRVGLIRYDISEVPENADRITASIAMNYHQATGYAHDWLEQEYEVGVYALDNDDMKWGWVDNGSGGRSIAYADVFVNKPADSIKAREMGTKLASITPENGVEEIVYSKSTSLMANGIRAVADITEYVKGVKAENPDEQYITLLFAVDDFSEENTGIVNGNWGLYFRGEKYVGGKNYDNFDEFRPRINWYERKKDQVNTIKSIELENGLMTEAFDPEATDEGEELVKTYKVAVVNQNEDVTLSYELSSSKATVSGDVTSGNLNGEKTLTIPVTSEAGVTRTYIFELVHPRDLGYTEDGKFEIEALEYEREILKNSSWSLKANLVNNSLLKKNALMTVLYIKDNKIIDEDITEYKNLIFGPVDEINVSLDTGDADRIVVWFSDITEGRENALYSIGEVAVAEVEAYESDAETEEKISFGYEDITAEAATVSGKWDASNSGINVYVADSGKDIASFDYENDSYAEFFAYANAGNTDADGRYSFDAAIAESGEYTVYVSDCEAKESILVSYIGSADRLTALDEIFCAGSGADIKEMLNLSLTDEERAELEEKYIETNGAEGAKNYVKILGLTAKEFSEGVSEERFCDLLYEMLYEYGTPEGFTGIYSDALIIARIYSGKIEDISVYGDKIILGEKEKALYESLTDEAKKNISSVKLAGKKYSDFSEIAAAVGDIILLEKISTATNQAELESVIYTYASELGISTVAYEMLEGYRKTAVLVSLIKNAPYESVSEFAKEFNDTVEAIAEEVIEFEFVDSAVAKSAHVVCPGNKNVETGIAADISNEFARIWEYVDGHANKKFGRVCIVRYDISAVPDNAESIRASIAMTYHSTTGYGHDWFENDFELGVYALDNDDMKWGWADGTLKYADLFYNPPADSFAIREMATKLGTITGRSDGTGDIERITSNISTSMMANGARASYDITDYVSKVKYENPDEKYVNIMFAMDSFVSTDPDATSNGLYFRSVTHKSNATDTETDFRPQLLWYNIKKSTVNTLKSVEIKNGFLEEEFVPGATDEGDALVKTYKVAVTDEAKDVELSYAVSSKKSTVEDAVTKGNLNGNKVLTVPVTSEAGETRTYRFELYRASELGYTKDGKLEVEALSYDASALKPNSILNLSAKVKNKSLSKKNVARVSIYIKNNKVTDEKFKEYSGIKPGPVNEISVGINTSDADRIVSWVSDVTDTRKLYSMLYPAGKVITIEKSGVKPGFAKKDELVSFYYRDALKSEITVSGKWHTGNTGLAVYVAKKNVDIEDYDYEFDTLSDFFVYAGGVNTDKDGYYGFDAAISKTGDYKVYLLDTNGIKEEAAFYFATPSDKREALNELYKDKSASALKAKLMLSNTDAEREEAVRNGTVKYNFVKLLSLSTGEIGTQITEDALINQLAKLVSESNDPEELPALYEDAILIARINAGKLKDVSEISEKAEIPEDILEIFETFEETTKAELISEKLAGNNAESYDEIRDIFNKNVVLTSVSITKNAELLTDYITGYYEFLGITKMAQFNGLNSVRKLSVINALIAKQPFAAAEEVKALFDKKTSELAAAAQTGNQGGGGSGGGGGGSSSGAGKGNSQNIELSGKVNGSGLNADVIENIRLCRFTDLDGYEWAEAAIRKLYEQCIIDGVSESSFNPAGKVKREEFVKMINTLYEGEEKETDFADVAKGAWYEKYIRKAVGSGIIKGMSEGLFGIGEGVTRQDMAVIVARALGLSGAEGEAGFADDAEISDYAKASVKALKNAGIVSGTDEGKFNPKAVMSRAEAAMVINNILSLGIREV